METNLDVVAVIYARPYNNWHNDDIFGGAEEGMLVRAIRYFLTGSIILGGLSLVAWLVTFTGSYQACQTANSRPDANDESNKSRPRIFLKCEGAFIDQNNGTLSTIATIFIAAFTLTLWRATSQQARLTRDAIAATERIAEGQGKDTRAAIAEARRAADATKLVADGNIAAAQAAKKSADISEQALHATQRAYVSAKPAWSINVSKPTDAVINIGFWMVINNGGNTPALSLTNRSAAVFLVKKGGEKFEYAKNIDPIVVPDIKTSIGPRSEITTDHHDFSIEHMAMVRDRTADLFLFGWLEYDDVFEGTPKHGAEWCFKISIEGKLRPGECQARFDAYDQHNRYYDCPPEVMRSE